MKVGDLVIMPGEKLIPGEGISIGLVVDDDVIRFPGRNKRVGVIWGDSDRVDFEPLDWLEVISESR